MQRLALAAVAACAISALISFGASDAVGQTTTTAPAAPAGDATRGKAAFLKYGCYECHGTLGQGNGFSGPTLAPHPIPFGFHGIFC